MTATSKAVPLDLDLVVRSHGWYDLPPFAWDRESGSLTFVFLSRSRAVRVRVWRGPEGLETAAEGDPAPGDVAAAVRRVLDLDAKLAPFYALCRKRREDGFGWIARRGAGRLLRCPTLFEDATKVLLTTNCTWGLTRAMVSSLVASFASGGAFPHAPFVAGFSEERLRKELKLGYRAPYLLRFAESVASGRTDLSRLEDPTRPDLEVEAEVLSWNGFGPYAAQTLGRLLGRHERLGLDSWSRKEVARLRFRGRAVSDRRIESFYRPFGRFAGLAFWLDVTRSWHEGKEKLWP